MEHLTAVRESRGFTVEELAKKSKISKNMIWAYEAGRRTPPLYAVCAMANALDCSLDLLVYGKEKDRHEGRSMGELLTMYRNLSDEQLDYLTALMQAVKADRQFQAHLRQVEKEGQ